MIIAVPDYNQKISEEEYKVKKYCINECNLSPDEKKHLIPLNSIPPTPPNPNAQLVFNTKNNEVYWVKKEVYND